MNEPTEEDTAECSTSSKRKRKLSNLEVADFIVEKGIKSETELLAIANEQNEGKKDLADFVLLRTSKCLNDLIQQTWKMKGASSTLEREKTSRMDLIRKAASVECATACEGRWLECAQEVLVENKVHPIVFAAALRAVIFREREVPKHNHSWPNELWQDVLTEAIRVDFRYIFKPSSGQVCLGWCRQGRDHFIK